MGKALTFGPMVLFAYQVFLAFTGDSPLTVYDVLPHHILAKIVSALSFGPYDLMVQVGSALSRLGS